MQNDEHDLSLLDEACQQEAIAETIEEPRKRKPISKQTKTYLIVDFLFVLVASTIVGVPIYFYKNSQQNKVIEKCRHTVNDAICISRTKLSQFKFAEARSSLESAEKTIQNISFKSKITDITNDYLKEKDNIDQSEKDFKQKMRAGWIVASGKLLSPEEQQQIRKQKEEELALLKKMEEARQRQLSLQRKLEELDEKIYQDCMSKAHKTPGMAEPTTTTQPIDVYDFGGKWVINAFRLREYLLRRPNTIITQRYRDAIKALELYDHSSWLQTEWADRIPSLPSDAELYIEMFPKGKHIAQALKKQERYEKFLEKESKQRELDQIRSRIIAAERERLRQEELLVCPMCNGTGNARIIGLSRREFAFQSSGFCPMCIGKGVAPRKAVESGTQFANEVFGQTGTFRRSVPK